MSCKIFIPDAELKSLCSVLKKIRKDVEKNKEGLTSFSQPISYLKFNVAELYSVEVSYDRNGVVIDKEEL